MSIPNNSNNAAASPDRYLSLQSGDITRDVYKWSDSPVGSLGSNTQRRRSLSFSESVHSARNTNPLDMSVHEMRGPNGFRRSFLMHKSLKLNKSKPDFVTRNFYEFLSLYGHFAGEDLSDDEDEDDEGEGEGDDTDTDTDTEGDMARVRARVRAHALALARGGNGDLEDGAALVDDAAAVAESDALLSRGDAAHSKKKMSTSKAVLLLLKSFVGTGVLFLPRGFDNGGWLFSSVCLLFCAVVSFYCFIILIDAKTKVGVDGYGELGARLFGARLKFTVLSSIVLSQIGFAAAYTVFTATNLQAFFKHVFLLDWPLVFWLVVQLVAYLPLSLTRNIAKLSATAFLADVFILLGLIYVYYYSSFYILQNGVASETMVAFNSQDWTLFIGTAIFTFEGIGLLIPIHESMEKPAHFKPALMWVLVAVTVVFISCGLICYSAFGANVETVILLNFPSTSVFANSVQFMYAAAILLSTPLQLFPAIKILENKVFPRHASGKFDPRVKWLKNYFRGLIVLITVTIAWIGANDLDKFVSLIGSFACIPLIYIYPPLFHFKVFQHSFWSRVVDLVILVFGAAIMAYTSWQTLSLWVS